MAEEQDNWREKYFESEKLLKELTSHSHQILQKYEDMKEKFLENSAQCAKVTKRLKEREEQLKQLQDLLQPAYKQYNQLQEKLSLESVCRQEAENFATKMSNENKELRRQSQALLDIYKDKEVPQLQPPVLENDDFQTYLEQLNVRMEEVETECAELKTELSTAKEDFEYEKEQHNKTKYKMEDLKAELSQTQHQLKQTQLRLQQLQDLSENAMEEYKALEEGLQEEAVCRFKAEEMASKLLRDNEVMKRQSAALIGPAMTNDKLMKALEQIDELTTQVLEQKQKYEAEIEELKERLEETQGSGALEELEKELEQARKENQLLQEQQKETESQYKELDAQCKRLQKQYEEIESKYQEAIRPPPPPPPPPIPTTTKSKGGSKSIRSFLGRNKGTRKSKKVYEKLKGKGVSANDDYTKVINDMMKRIQDGKPLNKVLKPVSRAPKTSTSEEPGPMSELQNLLSNLKRGKSEESLVDGGKPSGAERPKADKPSQGDSELTQVFRKVKKSVSELDESTRTSQRL